MNSLTDPFEEFSINDVPRPDDAIVIKAGAIVIDTRPIALFRAGHIMGSFNIPEGEDFEYYLQTLVAPFETFYLISETDASRETAIAKTAKAGYLKNIIAALVFVDQDENTSPTFDLYHFNNNTSDYTILDVDNTQEKQARKQFYYPVELPLQLLRQRIWEIPVNKPVAVVSSNRYNSAVAASVVQALRPGSMIYDAGDSIE